MVRRIYSRGRPTKKAAQDIERPLVNSGLLRFPRAGHVQDSDLVGAQEIIQRLQLVAKGIRVEYSFTPGVIDVQDWLSKLVGIVSSQLGTSTQETLKTENHGAIAFLDVPSGSRRIRGG